MKKNTFTSFSNSSSHKATREAKSRALIDDYVEAINDLIENTGEARITDIAKSLGVTHVTVTRMVTRLIELKLATSEPYRSVFLTKRGKAIAVVSRKKHNIVYNFLKSLGISEKNCIKDAEGIEHFVSKETLKAMEKAS